MFLACTLVSAQWQSKYEAKMLIDGSDTLRYRIMYPKNFKEDGIDAMNLAETIQNPYQFQESGNRPPIAPKPPS